MNSFDNMLSQASKVAKTGNKQPEKREPENRKLFNIPLSVHERELSKALKKHYNFASEAETIRYLIKDAARRSGVLV